VATPNLYAQNSTTIPGYRTATDFFRLQLPRDLVIRHPHGAKAIVADSLLMKQQLLIVNRSRRRVSLSLFGVVFGRF